MHIVRFYPSQRAQVRAFLELPFRLYANTPQWVPPLDFEARGVFDQRRNPFYQRGEAAFFLALDDHRRALGRLAVLNNWAYNQYNRENTAFFYLFECEADEEIAKALFSSAGDWARSRHLNCLRGPKGFSLLDGTGLLVNGFEHRPAFGLPYNLPYYAALVEAAGFEPAGELVSGYLSTQAPFPDKIHQIAQVLQRRRGLHVAHFEKRGDLRALLPLLKQLYNAALQGTQGNTPLTDAEVQALANQMLWFADPHLIKIVMKGEQPVGFLFAYPDISAAMQRTRGRLLPFGWLQWWLELRRTRWININGAGMIEAYRGLGGTALLFSELQRSIAHSQYLHADIVQVGTGNENMQREMRGLGIDFYKTHRIYQRRL